MLAFTRLSRTGSGRTPATASRASERSIRCHFTSGGIRSTNSTSSTSKSGAPERIPNGAPRCQMCSPSALPSTWSVSRYSW